jgi:hypothetical protein
LDMARMAPSHLSVPPSATISPTGFSAEVV